MYYGGNLQKIGNIFIFTPGQAKFSNIAKISQNELFF
jgi:hypothetical protein